MQIKFGSASTQGSEHTIDGKAFPGEVSKTISIYKLFSLIKYLFNLFN